MHGAADDIGDGDRDKCDGSKEDALNGSKNGAGARDVQQVDQAVFPAPHGDIVHTVLLGIGGCFPVIRSENLFAELAVQGGAHEQDDETQNKCCHKHTLLLVTSKSVLTCGEPPNSVLRRPALPAIALCQWVCFYAPFFSFRPAFPAGRNTAALPREKLPDESPECAPDSLLRCTLYTSVFSF